ncbi:MAG: hypothetical protein AAF357_07505 [Verrucomicrobiota bacterium]
MMKAHYTLLSATLVLFALFNTQIAEANPIKGDNVTMVMYQDPTTGQDVQVNMDPNDNSVWYEHSANGPFNFKVVARDEWSVYLWDKDRSVAMQIDLHQKKITFGAGDPSTGQITAASGSYTIKHSQ